MGRQAGSKVEEEETETLAHTLRFVEAKEPYGDLQVSRSRG